MEYEKALEIISSPKFAYARDDGLSYLLGICTIYDAKKILNSMGKWVEPPRW